MGVGDGREGWYGSREGGGTLHEHSMSMRCLLGSRGGIYEYIYVCPWAASGVAWHDQRCFGVWHSVELAPGTLAQRGRVD